MEPVNPSWLANLSVWFGVLMTIALAASTAGYTVVEAVKAGWPWLATAEGPWPARVKRGIAVVVGIGSGLCGAAASPEVPWFLCLLAGAVGGGFPALVRGLAVAKRNGVAEAVEGCVRAKSAMMTGRRVGSGLGMLAVAVLAGGLAAGTVACSAAQVATIRATGADLAACLLDCGVGAASSTIRHVGAGYEIEGEAIGYQALGCALPCLLRAGTVTVTTYASPPARWGGSAGEANVYVPDRIVITVSPRPAP